MKGLMLAALAATLAVVTAAPAQAITITSVTCTQYATSYTSAYGVRYGIDNDSYGGHPECLGLYGSRPAFTVTKSFTVPKIGPVQAYPHIFVAGMAPVPVWALKAPSVTWYWGDWKAPGAWNTSMDMWLAPKPGAHPSAEVMIWLDKTANIYKGTPKRVFSIDGALWYLTTWRAGTGATAWNYIQFRRVHPVMGVTVLKMLPFFWAAAHAGLLPLNEREYLTSAEAGHEIWSGGQGLTTGWFVAKGF